MLGDRDLEQLVHILHHCVKREWLDDIAVLAGVGEQLRGQLCQPLRPLDRQVDVAARLGVRRKIQAGQLGMPHNAGQDVVEVVRDPAGQYPQSFEPLGLEQLSLEGDPRLRGALALGDIAHDREHRDALATLGQKADRRLDLDGAPVGSDDGRFSVIGNIIAGEVGSVVRHGALTPLRWEDDGEVLLQNLLWRALVEPIVGRVCHTHDAVAVRDRHGVLGRLPHGAKARLSDAELAAAQRNQRLALAGGALQIGLDRLACGDIAMRGYPVSDLAARIGDRCHLRLYPKRGSVFAVDAQLDANRRGTLECVGHRRKRVGRGVWPVEQPRALANYLASVVASHVLERQVNINNREIERIARVDRRDNDGIVGGADRGFEEMEAIEDGGDMHNVSSVADSALEPAWRRVAELNATLHP